MSDNDWFGTVASAVVGGAAVAGLVALWNPGRASGETPDSESTDAEVSTAPELAQNRRRLAINRTGMLTLLGWSALNIGTGAYGWATTAGETRYFHQMNVFWNGINAVIGGIGYAQASGEQPQGLSEVETIEETRSMQQILALNAGLDVAYIAGGAWMREFGGGDDPRLAGYGTSVMLQGAFLFVFDAVLWALHESSISTYKTRALRSPNGGAGATLSFDF